MRSRMDENMGANFGGIDKIMSDMHQRMNNAMHSDFRGAGVGNGTHF